MIQLADIRHVRLGTRDLEGADHFARQVVGLQFAREEAGARYYRSDARDHTLIYFDGDPRDHTVGFELRSTAELETAAVERRRLAVNVGAAAQCEQRRVHDFIHFRDPSGNAIELVVRPQHSGECYYPALDAGITGFSHVGQCSTDPARDERFWCETLGAPLSDRIGAAPLLRIDGVHHRIALFATTRSGVQHVNHQVLGIDDLMRAWYRLQGQGVRIVFGPGRHPTSSAIFLYYEGPDGMIYEYSTGVRTISAEQEASDRPRQFPAVHSSFCMWGSVPDIAEFRRG